MKLYDAQDTWGDINARLMRLEVNESAEFVEANYEDSIAIYNESYETAIENYVSPDEDDADLIPVPLGTLGSSIHGNKLIFILMAFSDFTILILILV